MNSRPSSHRKPDAEVALKRREVSIQGWEMGKEDAGVNAGKEEKTGRKSLSKRGDWVNVSIWDLG